MTGVTPQNLGDIIEDFELQVADLTELSTAEEITLANKKYQVICDDRPWLFLRRPSTGALLYDSAAAMWYAPVPSDFKAFCIDDQYTDNTMEIENNAEPIALFVGANKQRYQVINYSDRRRYNNRGGVCYLDPVQNKIYFPYTPSDTSVYDFDYTIIPADLVNDTDIPVWGLKQKRYNCLITYLMAMDNDILQRSSAANSQQAQNNALYQSLLGDMQLWDADQYHN